MVGDDDGGRASHCAHGHTEHNVAPVSFIRRDFRKCQWLALSLSKYGGNWLVSSLAHHTRNARIPPSKP